MTAPTDKMTHKALTVLSEWEMNPVCLSHLKHYDRRVLAQKFAEALADERAAALEDCARVAAQSFGMATGHHSIRVALRAHKMPARPSATAWGE